MTLTYTLMFAAALALVNVWLAFRTIRRRYGAKVSIGHGADPLLETRMRAHANFAEYVPMALILMALIELRVGQSPWLFLLGVLLVLARLFHPFGMERPAPNIWRMAGVALTFTVTLLLAGWGLALLYMPPPAAGGVTYLG